MGLATLRAGQKLSLDGVRFELVGLLPSGDWQMMEADTGLRDEQSPDALWQAFLQGRLRFICDRDSPGTNAALLERLKESAAETPHDCSGTDLKEALHRLEYVRQIRALRGVLQCKDIIHETWERLRWPVREPTLRTVQFWSSKTRDATDPARALVNRNFRKGNRRSRYPTEVVECADDIVRASYLKCTPRITVARATEMLAAAVRKLNALRPRSDWLPIPGRRLIDARIALVPERERIAKRYGSDAALVELRTSLGGIKTKRALERAEIDHTLLAVVLLDDDFMPWGRASCSLCLDAHTRAPTGLYAGAEVPSIVSVAHCLKSSILPKLELLKDFPDIKGRWDCHGLHETYVVDNGLEEHAEALRHAASELGGSTVEFCPRMAPWFKPHVERYFRIQDVDLFQTLPGCTGENIATRPEFDPRKDLLLRRSTFQKILMKWLLDIYMREPQKALGDISPAEAWKRSITLEDQLVPTHRIQLERLFLRKECDRLLDHEGIQYDCLIYNSPEMGALRAQLGARLRVDIWVSDEDLGCIYVQVPQQDISIQVPCLNQDYASGLTRWQHKKCKAMRRVRSATGLQLSVDQARDEIAALIAMDRSELKHARRKKRTRFLDSSPKTAMTREPAAEKIQSMDASDRALMRSEDRKPLALPQSLP